MSDEQPYVEALELVGAVTEEWAAAVELLVVEAYKLGYENAREEFSDES